MRFGMISLGCCKNRVDSETALSLMAEKGYEITSSPQEADILMVNTCGFIEAAKQEAIDTILEMAEYKKKGRCRLLVVSGCLAQRYPEALLEDMPEIDLLLGVNQYHSLPDLVAKALQGSRPSCTEDPHTFFESHRILTTPGYTAYIRIGEGCSNFCTFCAIPLIRGRYRSRPEADILREAEELAGRGVREMTLIAQDTTRWGTDWQAHSALPDLMRRCADIPGVEWLRVLYCYPDETSEALLDLMAEHPRICPYLDLPIQHISDPLLKRMNRRGDSSDIRRCVRLARERGITLRTSIIVGFPGETEEQFRELLDFLEEARFDRLGAFAFSPEEGTPAASMPCPVDPDVRQERLDRLLKLQAKISLQRNQERLGTEEKVLVTGMRRHLYVGRSMREAPETDGEILFSSPSPLTPGTFVRLRLTQAEPYDLRGELL